MLPVTPTALSVLGIVEVPRYRIDAFDGKLLVLTPEDTTLTIDLSQVPVVLP
ncbi:hypothetical protein [Deinococcus sp. KSM4-11]|uniref:hypothetical protein n=1 Tax=Deinococcus sp. KSM4-11 TaxID=2568654 RepID=UPI001454E12E|nr:hypothetical protein [Deinococcus sp. KSM4-11]